MKIIDYSQNFNAIINKNKIKKALEISCQQLFSYPHKDKKELTKVIAKSLKLPEKSITIGNGATEIIFTLPRFFDNKNILILSPSFWEYSAANMIDKNNNIDFHILKEADNFQLNFTEFESKIKNFSTIYLCNPNNPTSTLIDKTKLLHIIKKKTKSIFIVDETYLIFREDFKEHSLIKEAISLNNLYIVISFSKFFSIPGLRIGILISKPKNIEKFNKITIPYLINPMAEIIIPYLLKQKRFIEKTKKFYSKQRVKAYKLFLNNFNGKLKIFKPEANFILVKILTQKTSQEVVAKLKKNGIILRDGSRFKNLGYKWLRIAIRTDEEMLILIKNLKRIIE